MSLSSPSDPVPEWLIDARAHLGECLLWCERTQALLWTDIEARTLHRWSALDQTRQQWTLPERLGSFALCAAPDCLLLGLASGIALFDLRSGSIGAIVPVEGDLPTTRINDGRCDRQGRFVFGTFNEQRGSGVLGHFYRVDRHLRVERLPLPPVAVPNSIAFNPQGTRMYYTDSPTREIRCVPYHADGTLGQPAVFTRFAEGDGFPDGAAVDADGGLWSTHWDGGCITRHAPDGRETDRIPLPVQRPTCPAFGGPGFTELFLTTARVGLKDAQRAEQPAAGGILRVTTAYRGLPEARFLQA